MPTYTRELHEEMHAIAFSNYHAGEDFVEIPPRDVLALLSEISRLQKVAGEK